MGLHPLLKNVPIDIVVAVSPAITKQYTTRSTILWTLGILWGSWFFLVPLSKFPITFGEPYHEIYAMPDYGTGHFYTSIRSKPWAIDFI